MNRKKFVRTLLLLCWLPFLCAALGAMQLADNAAYAHHKSLGWEAPVAAGADAQPSMPPDEPTIPDASLPARYRVEGAFFGFFSGAVIMLLAATVAGCVGPPSATGQKRARRAMA